VEPLQVVMIFPGSDKKRTGNERKRSKGTVLIAILRMKEPANKKARPYRHRIKQEKRMFCPQRQFHRQPLRGFSAGPECDLFFNMI